jgi:hypothetical protein
MMSAVAEQNISATLASTARQHSERMDTLASAWRAREAATPPELLHQVRAAHANEGAMAEASHNAELANVNGRGVWQLRLVLFVQQTLLSGAGVPGFAGPTVDANEIQVQRKVAGVCHSSVELRKQLGAGWDSVMLDMLKKVDARLLEEEGARMLA